ncbi:tRNA pseudouridine synthase A (tRNA pseudouridine(38-40) synthase) (tRNA pseudouridylate synthase I) (tRNA-uridine isomerase I) [Durusdinium trenchii]|uniref:tRNA pseudouridine synthase n=1 Tax=Durusdinium trenchii TaxID=1381693 RepID=A0ABP0KXU5_9DINO
MHVLLLQHFKHCGMADLDELYKPLSQRAQLAGRLPESANNDQLFDLVETLRSKEDLPKGRLLDVQFSRKDCSAMLSFEDARSALCLCWNLDGTEGPVDKTGYRSPLLALPESIMQILQEVHKRLRSSLKRLTGTRSFHNFSPGFADALDPKSIRSVYRCRSGVTTGFKDFLRGKAFAVLRITGRDFLYHQIRGMAGLVCAVTLGIVPEAYLELALGETQIEVPLAPAGHLVLAECFFRDGLFGCPFGQANREERDKVSERTLCSKDKVLILGSDGVWDRMISQEAVDIAAKHTDPNAAAREVASIARQRWHVETQGQLSDDITAVPGPAWCILPGFLCFLRCQTG